MTDSLQEATNITAKVSMLQRTWAARNKEFRRWYELISLKDDLKQPNMESVISTDPRTGFGLASWLLEPRSGQFKARVRRSGPELIPVLTSIEQYCEEELEWENTRSRASLFGQVVPRMIGLMLATGWVSLSSVLEGSEWRLEAWNPAETFPDYDGDELVSLGRTYQTTQGALDKKIAAGNWQAVNLGPGNHWIRSLWEVRGGEAYHGLTVDGKLLKRMEPSGYQTIPVVCMPVAGLPDNGSIMQSDDWRKNIGASVVAPVVELQKNFDKMLTYMQQLLRDTANPRWIEEVSAPTVEPERLFERGALFTIRPGEKVYPLSTPPLPAEMRAHQFDIRGQLQRAMFSDISAGDVNQQMSGFLMTQVVASAKKTLYPFFRAIKATLGETATRNLKAMRLFGERVNGKAVPDKLHLDYQYDIEIPGDFIQRANIARIMNPDFRLSTMTLYDVLFPEVSNPMVEQSNVKAEEAAQHPLFRQVKLIQELSRAVAEARSVNDKASEDMLSTALQIARQQLSSMGIQTNGVTGQGVPGQAQGELPAAIQEAMSGALQG